MNALLGNAILEQVVIYNIAGQLIGAALVPYTTALQELVYNTSPNVVLSPADLALAVVRNEIDEDTAAAEARFSGFTPGRFHTLTRLTGDAPAPEALAEALRRKLIDGGTYTKGIEQGRLRDEWADLVRELAVRLPSPEDAMQALVEGQIDEGTARAKYAAFGGSPDEFDWLYGTRGAGPSPTEAGVMANRGVIPWGGKGLGAVSFEQAIYEGHSRNKWEPAYRALAEYLPPPRTITAMVKEGAYTHDQAAALFKKHGLSDEDATAYLAAASMQKTATVKLLSESTVLDLYRDHMLTRDETASMLAGLRYTAPEAEFILQVEDLRLAEKYLSTAIGKVHTLYVGHKIDHSAATSALSALGMPAENMTTALTIWTHERDANVRSLTVAEIADAYGYNIIDQGTAQTELESLGYSERDAWVILSVKAKTPLLPAPTGVTVPPAPTG